jgi:hypothetical protein
LTTHQAHKLRNISILLKDNRRRFLETEAIKNKPKSPKARFSPNLSPRTIKLAEKSRKMHSPGDENLPIHDYLIKKKKDFEQNLMYMKNLVKEQEEKVILLIGLYK